MTGHALSFGLFAAGAALAQQPAWTTIRTGTMYGSDRPAFSAPMSRELVLPVAKLPAAGGDVNCGNATAYPDTFTQTPWLPVVEGLRFTGSFESPYPMPYLGGNIYEAVFFDDNPCFNGGREYGFFLATYDNSVWAYWGTNENQPTQQQGLMQLPGILPGVTYAFTMQPKDCGFEINITEGGATVYASHVDALTAGGAGIVDTDRTFCRTITSEPGYVTAAIQPASSQVAGTLPDGLKLSIQKIEVLQ